MPAAITQANQAFQELHDAYQNFQTILDEVENLKKNPPTDDLSASQKVGALVAGVGTVKKALDAFEVVGVGAGAVAIGGFALGMGVTLGLEKLYNSFDNWYDKTDLQSELRRNSVALDVATANFNHKTQKLYELIEEAGGKIEGVEIQFPVDLKTIVKDFKIPAT